jgi:hypothetical protein
MAIMRAAGGERGAVIESEPFALFPGGEETVENPLFLPITKHSFLHGRETIIGAEVREIGVGLIH